MPFRLWLAVLLQPLVVAFALGAAWAKPCLVVYPGSFDPITKAHVRELERVLRALRRESPDPVLAMVLPNHDRPTHLTPKARGRYIFDKRSREHLARAAFYGVTGIEVHPAFADGTGTADQLASMARRYGRTHELVLLVGEDAYQGMRKWPQIGKVLRRFNVLVSAAPDRQGTVPAPSEVFGALGKGYAARGKGLYAQRWTGRTVRVLGVPVPSIRSRSVALKLMTDQPVAGLVPRAVEKRFTLPRYRRAVAAAAVAQKDEVRAYRERLPLDKPAGASAPAFAAPYQKWMRAEDAREMAVGHLVTPRAALARIVNLPASSRKNRMERLLERERQRVAPNAPSRLTAVFAAADLSQWSGYAEGGRVKVRLAPADPAKVAVVDHRHYERAFDFVEWSESAPNASEKRRLLRKARACARRYWHSALQSQVPGGKYEVLLGGGARFGGVVANAAGKDK